MLPYWLLFGFFAGGALPSRLRQRSEPMTMYWVGWVLMTLMIGLRFHVGVDWANYQTIWRVAGTTGLAGLQRAYGGDPAFYGLVWLLRNGGFPFWTLDLVCAFVFTLGLFRYSRLQPNPWLAITIAIPYLVIVIAMSGLRQATALGFVFLSLTAYSQRRTLAFLGWIACAALFHASSIITLAFAGLAFARNRFQAGVLIIVSLVFAYYVLGSTFGEYSRDYLGGTGLNSSGTAYRLAMTVLAALLYFVLAKRLHLEPHDRMLWRNYSLFALASIPALAILPSSTAVDRLLLYLYPLQLGVLSHTPFAAADKVRDRVLITAAIILYLAATLFVFLNYAVNRSSYLPFQMYPFVGS